MKPKTNRISNKEASSPFDRCFTPPYALAPIIPFINKDWIVWECAAGDGHMSDALRPHVTEVISTDIYGIYANPAVNFFNSRPDVFDAIITNPPYSLKFDWIEHCYELGKPFALLLPVETIGAQRAQRSMQKYGAEILLLNRRVDFCMPNKGWKDSSAQFPVLWFCWNILPEPIMYGEIVKK